MPREQLVLLRTTSDALALCLEMFTLHLQASKRTPKTLKYYEYTLGGFVQFLRDQGVHNPANVTATHLRTFLTVLDERELSPTTLHHHARAVKTWFNFLVAEEILDTSPVARVTVPSRDKRIHKPFTIEDVEALLDACGKDLLGLRDKAIVLCLLDSGVRISEFAAMNVGDVDKAGMVVVHGKGGKDRYVRLGARARKALLRYLAKRGEVKHGDPLWVGTKGRLTPNGINQTLRRLGKRAGVHPANPHRFRRTFALWCLRGGVDAHELRLLLGHTTLTMALRYLDMVKEDVEAAHKRGSPVNSFLDKGKR